MSELHTNEATCNCVEGDFRGLAGRPLSWRCRTCGGRSPADERVEVRYLQELAGKPLIDRYSPVALEDLAGKTIEAVLLDSVEGGDGEEPCLQLLFTDGTQHGFVLPARE